MYSSFGPQSEGSFVYTRGSQTGRRDTLPRAPPKRVKVAYYCNKNNGFFMLNIFCKLYNYIFLC